MGFSKDNNDHQKMSEKIIERASEILRPEFVNRLTEVITFKPFSRTNLSKILSLELKPIRVKLKEKGISLHLSQGTRDAILKNVEGSKFGARPIARIIQKQIEDPLSELLISGELAKGHKISFNCRKDNIYWKITEEQAA